MKVPTLVLEFYKRKWLVRLNVIACFFLQIQQIDYDNDIIVASRSDRTKILKISEISNMKGQFGIASILQNWETKFMKICNDYIEKYNHTNENRMRLFINSNAMLRFTSLKDSLAFYSVDGVSEVKIKCSVQFKRGIRINNVVSISDYSKNSHHEPIISKFRNTPDMWSVISIQDQNSQTSLAIIANVLLRQNFVDNRNLNIDIKYSEIETSIYFTHLVYLSDYW